MKNNLNLKGPFNSQFMEQGPAFEPLMVFWALDGLTESKVLSSSSASTGRT